MSPRPIHVGGAHAGSRTSPPCTACDVTAALAELTGTDDDIEAIAESLVGTERANGAALKELNALHSQLQ
eukprot:1357267-Prymnesium_polylepis.1